MLFQLRLLFIILKKKGIDITTQVFFGMAILIFAVITGIIISNKEYLLLGLLTLSSLSLMTGIYRSKLMRAKMVDKFYAQLSSLIGSLRLEASQQPFTTQKRNRMVYELDDVISGLAESVNKKTNELRNRNLALKSQQYETLKKNKELLIAYSELKRSRERYDKLVKTLDEEYYLYTIDQRDVLKSVSPSVEKILGYSASEYKAKRTKLITRSDINAHAKTLMSEVLGGVSHEKFLVEVYHKDCTTRMLEISEVPVLDENNRVKYIEGVAHNITERYNAEELIREQEEKYRQVFNSASDFIFLYGINRDGSPGKFIEANTYTQNCLGYSQEELQQMSPDDLNAADIWDGAHERQQEEKYERIWESKEGIIINVEISEHTYKIKGKTVCIAVARDITDRKRAVEEMTFMNEELVNQKENLEALLDNLTQTQEQLVQSEKMAALGQLIAGVAHEINTPLGAIKASVGNLSDSLESALTDLPQLFQNQSEQNLKLFLLIFELSRADKVDLTSREKRERKRNIRRSLSEQNINNADVIADLLVYLEVYEGYEPHIELLKQPETLTVLRNARDFISLLKNTKTISIAAEKAAKVVFALKKYAHRDALGERIPTDIIDGIETVLTLYDNQLKQGMNIVKNYKELPTVMCYADEINQVWTNIIQNALHAMGQVGELTITTQSDEEKIMVSIKDTGDGIDPTILDKIFDPFYTTKKQGEGSGLGLDIVKKIIDKHNGTIEVQSEMGEGTNFIVTLPII